MSVVGLMWRCFWSYVCLCAGLHGAATAAEEDGAAAHGERNNGTGTPQGHQEQGQG